MAAQFGHIQTFGRKLSANKKGSNQQWTVSDIAKEAGRDPDHSKHVENVQEPILIKGFPVDQLELKLEEFLQANKVSVETKKGTQERSARADAHVLLCSVYSWPEHVDYYDEERLKLWIEDAIKFHEKEHGEAVSVVLHLDEEFPHIHVYSFSNNAKKELHPGFKAKAEAVLAGADTKQQSKAYNDAMKGWQDRYFEQVGARNGLDRLGPKRQRISRKEWREAKPDRQKRGDMIRSVEEKAVELMELNQVQKLSLAKVEEHLESLKAREAILSEKQTLNEQSLVNAEKELSQVKMEHSEGLEQLKNIEKSIQGKTGVINGIKEALKRVFKTQTPEEKRLLAENERIRGLANSKIKSLKSALKSSESTIQEKIKEVRKTRLGAMASANELEDEVLSISAERDDLTALLSSERIENKELRDQVNQLLNNPKIKPED